MTRSSARRANRTAREIAQDIAASFTHDDLTDRYFDEGAWFPQDVRDVCRYAGRPLDGVSVNLPYCAELLNRASRRIIAAGGGW